MKPDGAIGRRYPEIYSADIRLFPLGIRTDVGYIS
jgi:hypothetical protein